MYYFGQKHFAHKAVSADRVCQEPEYKKDMELFCTNYCSFV